MHVFIDSTGAMHFGDERERNQTQVAFGHAP